MTTHSQIRCLPEIHHVTKGLPARLVRYFGVWRQRRALENLDDAALNDIGITRAEALSEARRPIWDVPTHWRH